MTSSLAVDRFAAKKGSLRSPRGRLVASLTRSRTIRVQLTNLTVYKKGALFSLSLFVEGVIFVWGIFNLQKYCCNLFCTRPLHKGKQGCTSLHFWVSRIHQWCSTWSIRHCMTSYHSRQGMHWRSFRHQGPASTFHLLQPPFSS